MTSTKATIYAAALALRSVADLAEHAAKFTLPGAIDPEPIRNALELADDCEREAEKLSDSLADAVLMIGAAHGRCVR